MKISFCIRVNICFVSEPTLVQYQSQYLNNIGVVNICFVLESVFVVLSNVGTVMTSCAGSQHHIRPYVGKLERYFIVSE